MQFNEQNLAKKKKISPEVFCEIGLQFKGHSYMEIQNESTFQEPNFKVYCLLTDYHFTPNAIITDNGIAHQTTTELKSSYIQNYFKSNGLFKNDENGK